MLKCLSLELRQCKREYGLLVTAILVGFFIIGLGFGYFGFRDASTRFMAFEELFLILFTVFTLGIMAVWVIVIIRLFTTYENNMFKVNGYLYNTLPVNSWEMILAKVLFVNIWVFIFSLVSVVGLLLFFGAVALMGIILDSVSISDMVNIMRSIDWVILGRNIINLLREIGWLNLLVSFVREILVSSSLYLCGLLFITFYYTSWIQQLNKVIRVIIAMVIIALVIFAVSNLHFTLDTLTIFITTIGILSFIATCWLIDHKVDVNC